MKMYKVSTIGSFEIKEVEIIKKSDKSVWLERIRHYDGKIITERELKETSYYRWFDTYQEARNFIIDKLKVRITAYKNRVTITEAELKGFE